MSNGPTSLFPPSLAGASAKAAIQSVAVRLIQTPPDLQNNPAPVRIRGQVTGQTGDGTLVVETERGLVELALKDRQSLPKGTQIEIDIPAGRSPSTANIRPAQEQITTQQSATLQRQETIPTEQLTPLTRQGNLDSETLGSVINSRQLADQPALTRKVNIALQPDQLIGQTIRLSPVTLADPSIAPHQLAAPLDPESVLLQLANALLLPQKNDTHTPLSTTAQAALKFLLPQIALPASWTHDPARQQVVRTLASLIQQTNAAESNPPFTTHQTRPQIAQATPIDAKLFGLQVPVSSHTAMPELDANNNNTSGIMKPLSLPIQQTSSAQGTAGSQTTPQPTLLLLLSQNGQANSAGKTAPVLIGQMIGKTSTNQPVISVTSPTTGQAHLYTLPFPLAGLPSTESGKPQSTLLLLGLQADQSISGIGKNPLWTSFQDMLFFLETESQTATPNAAATAAAQFANMLPSPLRPDHLGPLAMLFLSLLGSNGDLENFLPTTSLDLLRQNSKGRNFLDMLSGDLAKSGSSLQGTQHTGDWRGLSIPFWWEQHIYKIPLYYKHLPDDESDGHADDRRKRRLRFLFDLQLSRMGDVQIDGFLQAPRLDLILRTKTPLSVPMQEKMKQIYAGAVEKSQLTGDLGFQFKAENWVDFSAPLDVDFVET